MHHCTFLIITFSSYVLGIQNYGKSLLPNHLERNLSATVEARQSIDDQKEWDNTGFIPSSGTGIRFSENHHLTTNGLNDEPSPRYQNPYPNSNQAARPHNLALNTGEYTSIANNHNNYPYQLHPNRVYGDPNAFNANVFHYPQRPPSIPYRKSYYKNPNYPPTAYPPFKQRPIYAHVYDNYLYNRQPNYNRRPTPPPSPPSLSSPQSTGLLSSPIVSPYQTFQGGHLTSPYRQDLISTGQTIYSPPNENQFSSFSDSSNIGSSANPLGGLLGNIGAPFAAGNPLTMQIIQGLENIARNDDLECVPKVLCQMLGSPSRRLQLPSFITSPALTSFVASLPSTSPAVVFGRAALLGLSGGDHNCARTYNKCPQNEDDILYYLNNHRGGFFKFFNEAGTPPVLDPQQQKYDEPQGGTQSQQQQMLPSIFNFLSGFGTTTTTSSNSGQGDPNSVMSGAITNGIGGFLGNVISGFLTGQMATRRNDEADNQQPEDESSDLIEPHSSSTPKADEPEGRILNSKSHIQAYEPPQSSSVTFPQQDNDNNYEEQPPDSEFRFPSTSHRDETDDSFEGRKGRKVNFIDSEPHTQNDGKMIFPDRTGTGNLRFDNEEFFRVGRILNRPSYSSGYKPPVATSTSPNYIANRESQYPSTTYVRGRPHRYDSSYIPVEHREKEEGNIYVTNAQGVIEYYINKDGRKVYV